MTWPEVTERSAATLLVVPLGSTEQHGPHLPLSTDTDVAVALADRLAANRPDAVVAPALAYGSSGEHAGFAGTLSIGQEVLEAVVVELVRSADAFAAVLLVSTHGGNAIPLHRAVRTLLEEGRRVRAWPPPPGGHPPGGHPPGGHPPGGLAAEKAETVITHAGRTETSLALALHPERVRLDLAEAGDTRPLAELWRSLRSGGMAAVSPNGVLGDPTGASPAEGRRQLAEWTAALEADIAGWP